MGEQRFCIIPSRALDCEGLKGQDLRVLCYIGKYADKHGWWRLSQVKMAENLGCARSTVQASVGRLIDAELLEKHVVETESGRDSAHYYRVILDYGSPETGTPDAVLKSREKAKSERQNGLGTPADMSAPPAGIPAPPADPESAPPAGPGSAPSITTHSNVPPSRSERERAGAGKDGEEKGSEVDGAEVNCSEVGDPKSIERAFKRFAPTWPTWISDSEPEARRAWNGLTGDEREQAEARAPDYHAAAKASGRKQTCSLAVYLREKRWEKMPAASVKSSATALLKPYGPRWWAYRRMLCEAGPTRRWMPTAVAQKQIDDAGGVVPDHWLSSKAQAEYPQVADLDKAAADGRGKVVTADQEPAVAETMKLQVGSDEWDAFCGKHREKGWPVPEVRRGVEWLDIGILANAGGSSGEAGIARDGGAKKGGFVGEAGMARDGGSNSGAKT